MAPFKVVCDTNIYVAYLLSAHRADSAIDRIFLEAARQSIEVLLPIEVIIELTMVTRNRPRVAKHIDQHQIDRLLHYVTRLATVLPQLDEAPPAICRDPDDNFLIATCVVHGADFLVTRDQDLLTLNKLGTMHIVDPLTFLPMIEPSNRHLVIKVEPLPGDPGR